MARRSPLLDLHEAAGAVLSPWGPPGAGILVPQAFAEIELEYAAIRRSAALFDQPQRGTLVIRGSDRLDFLNRMVTQELKGMAPMRSRRAFWLNRRGRIDADLRLMELGDRIVADVDVTASQRAREGLAAFVITEDVSIEDASEEFHRLALHGPSAARLIAAVSEHPLNPPEESLEPGAACVMRIAGREVIVVRDDALGEVGLELLTRREDARPVFERLHAFAREHDPSSPRGPNPEPRLRPAGWRAYNIARIEAGTPIYNIDFGPDSLPHESGVLRDRVSFTKGCYLGQEVVARMESRGHSKRVLVGLRCDSPPAADPAGPLDHAMPVGGSPVFAAEADDEPVGVVTSATPSPMLGATAICFAAVRPAYASAGSTVHVEAEGTRVRSVVQPALRFLTRRP